MENKWTPYGSPYGSHMGPIWIPIWIPHGSLYGSPCGSHIDPYIDPHVDPYTDPQMSVAAPPCGIIVRDDVFSSRDRWERSRAHAENRSETKHVSFWGDFRCGPPWPHSQEVPVHKWFLSQETRDCPVTKAPSSSSTRGEIEESQHLQNHIKFRSL